MLNLEEVKIENEDLQAEVDQLRNQLVFAEENNARRIREIKTESSNEVFTKLYFLECSCKLFILDDSSSRSCPRATVNCYVSRIRLEFSDSSMSRNKG